MPLVVKDRVRETSTTAGTGTFTLAGAVTGYQSFSAVGDGNTTYYTIYLQGGNEWEVGIGTYTASGTTLSRDTVLASSSGGSKINFSAGVKDVFVTYPAGRSVYYDTATNVTLNALTVTGALAANGGTTIGDAAGDAFTINSSAVSVPNGLNFDSNTLVIDAANDRVGIGTNSPFRKLDIALTPAAQVTGATIRSVGGTTSIGDETSIDFQVFSTSYYNGRISGYVESITGNGKGGLKFYTSSAGNSINATPSVTLDSSGNLGLGVTPSAWGTQYKAVQNGQVSLAYAGNYGWYGLLFNAYSDNTNFLYIAGNRAGEYRFDVISGSHAWYNAPSGTVNSASVTSGNSYTVVALGTTTLAQWQAFFNDSSNNPLTVTPTLGQVLTGNATGTLLGGGLVTQNISFTQAMTLDASGNLGIGTPSPQSILELKNASPTITLNGTTNNAARGLIFQSNGTQFARITSNFSTGEMRFLNGESGQTGYYMTFFTDSTERARITSGGTFQTSLDASIYGVTVGRGAGAVATNTAVGASALYTNSTGGSNSIFGNTAGYYVTGSSNSYFGYGTGSIQASASGSNNSGFGRFALQSNTSGAYNTALGDSALYSNNTASNNTAVGYQAGYSNTTGTQNAFFGRASGYANTTGDYNAIVGDAAGYTNTTGSFNTVLGQGALYSNTTASNNTAVGYQAGYSNTTGVATFGTVTGGSGYTNGTYNGVQLTYSSGTAATTYPTANIVVSGGAVSTVTLVSTGTGFKDTTTVLTAPAASIGGTGSGFTVPVATLAAGSNNTAVGYQAAYANTTGGENTAVGFQTLQNNTTGSNNTAFGLYALVSNTTGGANTAIGRSALNGNTTASNNTAVGYQAGYTNQTGTGLTYLGYQTAYYQVGSRNTAVGQSSFVGNSGTASNGTDNSALGYFSLLSNTTGSYNTAIGVQALQTNTTASNNTAVGYQAGYLNTTGTAITAIGKGALAANTTAIRNTALGTNAAVSNTTGADNLAAGADALFANTTGAQNTALGSSALQNNTTASNNTAVGYQALYNVLPATISVSAGALTNGVSYTITGLGTVNWTSIGAASATVGITFTYNNVAITGSGGSVTQNVDAKNTAIGYGSGSAITTGTKNTIIGSYGGNSGGIDIRAASNWIVLSDGDGNPTIRAYGLTGQVTLQQVGQGTNFPAIKQSGFGYSPSTYGALVIGAPAGWNQTVSINYDPSSNASGSFSGLGGEVMFRNGVTFIQPNSANNNFQGVMVFETNGSGVRFNQNIGVGGTTPTSSGTGVTFPATQAASSDANTLDDYEEGTFDPEVTFGGGSTGVTYTSKTGFYRKIGSLVFFSFRIILSSKGSSTGNVKISIPFPAANISRPGGANLMYGTNFTTVTAAETTIDADQNTSVAALYTIGAGSSLTDSNFQNTTDFLAAFCYISA